MRRVVWVLQDLLVLSIFLLLSLRFLVPLGRWGLEGWRPFAEQMVTMWVLVEADRLRETHSGGTDR